MRGVLLLLMTTIPALFVFACVSNDVTEPTKTGEVTATGKGLNFHLSVNGNSELSYRDIISKLREFGEEVDVERGLTGLNENGISENTATFSAGPEVSIGAPSIVFEFLVEARIYKLNVHLVLADESTHSRLLEMPTEEGLSSAPDYTDKIHVVLNRTGNITSFSAWIGQNDWGLMPPEEEVVFPDDDSGIVWPELDPPPTDDFDEDASVDDKPSNRPARYCLTDMQDAEISGTSVFKKADIYLQARKTLTELLRKVIAKPGRKPTGCIVHFDTSGHTRWGAQFMALDAGFELGLEYPVYFSWAKYEYNEE